jgi:hypothetical protein
MTEPSEPSGAVETIELQDPVLAALWKQAWLEWDSEGTHRALLEHAQASGQLAALAERYRSVQAEVSRVDRAQRQLKAIVVLALSQLDARRPAEPVKRESRRGLWWVVLLFLVGSAVLLTQLYLTSQGMGP